MVHQNYKSKNNWWFRWSFLPQSLLLIPFYQIVFILSCSRPHCMLCVAGNNVWPMTCPELLMFSCSPPSTPNMKSGYKVIRTGRSCLFFHLSSKLSHAEWGNRVVLHRVDNSNIMRIIGTNWYILPSFKIMCYHLQRLHILIWLSLLSFSKTEAKSGKLCFLFTSCFKVPIRTCLPCSISVTQTAIE